ncbi:SpdA protein [Streptomyces sp. ME19-01-6]|uniref:SpdA protein n=1 Tax=Streptomyces sp. ME19-01-6 TaxID=3028686 RepID=UPI0029AB434F|nr:SpdA protein [Streptomyces sp. ME19-01-6]MDX3224155.1 SpdA protein [Streptomyces sp. ME19-01-6]
MNGEGPAHASGGAGAAFERVVTLRAVTGIMAAVVGLTFLFGFGNVWTLALRLGVPPWVAPLVAPAVDLSVLGLLLGTRYLALQGASREQLRPARRLLVFSSLMSLALNLTDPLLAGQNGKAAFDAVGPLLLIGWAEVGPGLLQAISGAGGEPSHEAEVQESPVVHAAQITDRERGNVEQPYALDEDDQQSRLRPGGDDLLERALAEDAWHWETYQRPISAETLRKRLRVGAARSRMLVATVRSTRTDYLAVESSSVGAGPSIAQSCRQADGAGEEGLADE